MGFGAILSNGLLAILLSGGSAAPLSFLEITNETVATRSDEVRCVPVSRATMLGNLDMYAAGLSCKLTRGSFADIPITVSRVKINPETHKVRSIYVGFDRAYQARAEAALRAKFGSPGYVSIAQMDWRFSEDASVHLLQRAVLIVFGSNDSVETKKPLIDF